METKNYTAHLKALAKEYSSENVSLLIGAGFSKNALSDFPSWGELLTDMIMEMYREKFINNPDKFVIINPHVRKLNKNFKKEKVQEIINEVGYLEIVSNFLKKKTMREAIEVYIEERTPYAHDNKFVIPYNNRSIAIEESTLSLHEKLLEGKWEQIYTTNYDNLLEYTAKIKSKEWQEITNGYDLSFSDTKKNIIKIHGSLRTIEERNENKKFVFDNCHEHCYIITKEDYDNYPIQHEAFTQLMRITLLKGVFCLIGFSGNDPNFLSWLKWVKDILVRKQKDGSTPKIKVYIITIDDKEISPELELYYANHHICLIPLKNPTIKQEINGNGNVTKELINDFLEYLYDSGKKEEELYNQFWDGISRDKLSVESSELLALSKELGFKKDIYFQKHYLSRITFPDIDPNVLQLEFALLAISDICSTIESYRLEEKLFKNINNFSPQYQELYSKLKNRNLVLTNSPDVFFEIEDKDSLYFDKVLKCAFNLDFETLKVMLDDWQPKGIYVINKASLMSLFDTSAAKELLLGYINNKDDNYRNEYLAVQTLNFLRDWNEKKYSTTNYKNQSLDSFYDVRDELIKDVLDVKEKIKPRGKDVENSISKKTQEALRLLNFFINTGPQITSKTYVNIDSSKWYQIFKELYIYFPYPCFYFTLQFETEDTIQRIGQDFADSDHLIQETEFLLLKSLDNIIEKRIPKKMVKSTYLICSNMLCAVKPSKWEKKFIKIWDEYLLLSFASDDRRNEVFTFIKSGLPQLKSRKNKIKVIIDCINHRDKNFENSIDMLYYLKASRIKLDSESSNIINNFIKNISKPIEISIAGNLYNILTSDNINIVSEKITQFLKSDNKIPNNTIYQCTYFLKKTKIETNLIKNYIINNQKLWDNGISEKSATYSEFYRLSHFEYNLKWNISEIKTIFFKLKISLKQLLNSEFYKNDDGFFKNSYTSLLDEMFSFLVKNNVALLKEPDYVDLVDSLETELQKQRGFKSLNEGLTSDDTDQVYLAINLLYRQIKESTIDKYCYQLNLLVFRFLNKKKEGLPYCFDVLDYFVKTYFVKTEMPNNIEESLILGLNQYDKDVLIELNLDVPKMSKHLSSLAEVLAKKGNTSIGIEYWLKFKKEKRFN